MFERGRNQHGGLGMRMTASWANKGVILGLVFGRLYNAQMSF